MTSDTHDELAPGAGPLETPGRVLTIGAHPDDAEFGCGATLARWADSGADITMCVVTDGSKGSWDREDDPTALARERIREQEAAGAVLGARRFVHLGHVDGELEYSMDLRIEVARQIRIHRPDVVLSHDPWQRYQLHPDHRATGLAAVDGIVTAREPRALGDSGLDAHRPIALLLWSADEPDHAELVDDDCLQRKVDALMCHASQSTTTMGGAADSPEDLRHFVEKLEDWHRRSGARLGVGPAETFKRLTP